MTDFHAHVLPAIDDGPRSMDESMNLVRDLYGQGVTSVVCTPHFYPSRMSIDHFLRRREDRIRILRNELADSTPVSLVAGAEVYCDEFLRLSKQLDPLLIEGTSLLMLELPFTNRWSSQVWEILEKTASNSYLQILVAHADRYPALYKHSSKNLRRLIDMDCLIQINCDSLLNDKKADFVCKWIEKGYVHLLGTDCHNLESRPPRMKQAQEMLVSRYGNAMFEFFRDNAQKSLSGKKLKNSGLFF
jgi:protein-tyrosine phosphatase